ncbi:lectin-like protein [uncultured Mediterranean phage uvMED]|nr:lectin-like protein [uncultured Mediterranean phage uvMED]BAR15157.1 lectin-like protein [uncultured Mediterranean phage uvMED]
MANTYLTKTFSSAGNRKKWTWSAWIKRSSGLGSQQCLLACSSGATVFHLVYFDGNDKLVHNYNQTYCNTDRVFRDTNAWYHLVCAVDTTQATASNRVKFYVNGVQETLSGNFPSQNTDMTINNNVRHDISNGGANFNNNFYFDGSMSHIHFCDGYQYQASDFGSTDSTTGEWKINTSPSVTYGTNGFFILKNGNSVTDQSGNSNNFTVAGGTLTKTEDNPSNVFATGNSLIGVNSNGSTLVPTFSNGNNTATATGSAWRIFKSTLGASSGKYYAEFKWISDSNTRYAYVGIHDEDDYANKISGYPYMGNMANGHAIGSQDGDYYTNGGQTSFGSVFSNGSIIGVAMDLDNSKVYFSKDGTWQGSANPTNGTGGKSITANKTYTFGVQIYSVGSIVYSANFGNGYFGTTAVSSAGTNASGNGIFEYDVPTGYTALSTKGLNL